MEGTTAVRVGGRALAILEAMVERAGEVVSKAELMARVWPSTVVEDSNLKVNMSALRRALGEGQPGRRYVATVIGHGYRFAAPVQISAQYTSLPPVSAAGPNNLPASSTRTIGRASTIDALLKQLSRHRFITVVGAGGIGKTTVALAAAEALIASYEHGVWFVDLAPLRDASLVSRALISSLGLAISFQDPVAALKDYLRDRRMLIVLDNCEHLIDAGATLAEELISSASGIHILATSREPLRARGERVHRLAPLGNAPASVRLTAAEALAFPAVQLFVERAIASVEDYVLHDADAPVVAGICRKLDGIALAIELAATRIDAFGPRELSKLLDDRFRLLRQDRRTALPRHRSLAAALDWSYELLSMGERSVLNRLSVFAGAFGLECAAAVASDSRITGRDVINGIESLVAKSLVVADASGAIVRYRLLDTTRSYALQKLNESGELEMLVRRHAEHHRQIFSRAASEVEARPTADWLADYGHAIDDVRNALSWAFSADGDTAIGVALTVAAIPLWMHMSLIDECRVGIDRALASNGLFRNDHDDMKLYAGLAAALLHERGPLPEVDAVWTKALQIAERLGDREYQLRPLWGLAIGRFYVGDYRLALDLLRRFRSVAQERSDVADLLSCDRLIGSTLHYLGDQREARRQLEHTLGQHLSLQHSHIARFQYDQRVAAKYNLTHILWLLGFPDQALGMTQSALEDAEATGHAFTVCNVLIHGACPLALYVGDLATAQRLMDRLQDHLTVHARVVSRAEGDCLKGMLLVAKGDRGGLPLLRDGIDRLTDVRYRLRYPLYLGTLGMGLHAAGQTGAARTAIEQALGWCEQSDERWCMAELLRIQGHLMEADGAASAIKAAEIRYRQSLEWARLQGALSWELRTAICLAQLWRRQGIVKEAEQLLSSVYDRFTEGFETADLKKARSIIEELRRT
nr:winged helix-turn-helix domain-containing protein [Bradyrhizobium diazoefficiens]